MKTSSYLALVCLMVVVVVASFAVLAARAAPRPARSVVSPSEMPTGAGDVWDENAFDTPSLAPGAAIRIAREHIRWVRSPDYAGGWMLEGLTLQRVSLSAGAGEWVYLVNFNACFAADSGREPVVLRVPVKFDGRVPPGAIDPALFCPVAHTLAWEKMRTQAGDN